MNSTKAESIRALVNSMIEREIERCKKQMGDREWEKHKEWVTANIVAAAKIWLNRTAAEGLL
ncbi:MULTISPECIES: hypothetical protein [Burkholderia]|uniref:hypothetical protein n=1 Tax=Burkholderia TaxID=32008 RepID=UPI00117763A0|nr:MULTISPECIES: hypothetical protein [Burkholderia]MBY4724623.1 hypothetical protein [Burkholderia contaminans]MCI3972926.1 hypothetical protein [Burkholderia sp. HI4860]MDN7788664.1 hypothetical protein [Burkholderia contaminans]